MDCTLTIGCLQLPPQTQRHLCREMGLQQGLRKYKLNYILQRKTSCVVVKPSKFHWLWK